MTGRGAVREMEVKNSLTVGRARPSQEEGEGPKLGPGASQAPDGVQDPRQGGGGCGGQSRENLAFER